MYDRMVFDGLLRRQLTSETSKMIFGKSNRYDFIVTGASGSVGRHLIPILANNGYRILALGRNPTALRRMFIGFPDVDCADYQELSSIEGCDTLIHLAVRNNNQVGSIEDFVRDNIEFSDLICQNFIRLNGVRFINLSSIHSLGDKRQSLYAVTKYEAYCRLEGFLEDRLDNVYIGYFHSTSYFGEKVRWLEKVGGHGKLIFSFFKLFKPCTSAHLLGDYVISSSDALPHPNILTDDLSRSWAYRGFVRALDVAAAVMILVLLLPVFAVLWFIIHLDSSGPAIFAQTRVGKEQVPFTLYKFRTMKRDTVSAGTHEVSFSAVTKVGRILRKIKLDELPQAINLLRGEMTLVGPRPCLPMQKELIEARSALGVYAMKPGITGFAQIRDIDMSRPQDLAKVDYIYMKLQSLTLNLKIILLTATGRGGGDRVDLRETP